MKPGIMLHRVMLAYTQLPTDFARSSRALHRGELASLAQGGPAKRQISPESTAQLSTAHL